VVFEGPFRHAIHTMKYGRNASIAETLAVHLALYARELGCQVDLAVPVPLGKQRTNERGYNQVGLLARPLAGIPDWRYSPQALVRTREIRSQVGFFPLEHKKNISGAFRAGPTLAAGKDMLLVDDIVTTGATLAPCSDALVKAGERNIYALTPARHYRTTDLKLFDKIQTSQGANYDS
jgi:ComF family protein